MSYRQLARFAFCAVMVPAAATAQQVEFGPLVALYSPIGSYDHPANFFRIGTPDRPSDNRGVDHPSVITPGGLSPGTSSHVTSATAQATFGRWELSDLGAVYQRGFENDLLVHAGLTLSLR